MQASMWCCCSPCSPDAEFAHEPGGYGTFRLPDGVLLRHRRRECFDELLADFKVGYSTELDVLTMNGNPARILQFWATTADRPE